MTADPKQILIYIELPAGDPLFQALSMVEAMRTIRKILPDSTLDWEVIDSGVHK